uniref:NADH-ubiquinone oxidoreductase chain 6 n=1 Tax=Cheironitis hoplosternus TaxID=206730 RepID=A0A1X9HDK7_9SCAR|nr:NADH deshydrogenase subunit 6 [Cheironitis hoplosternus]
MMMILSMTISIMTLFLKHPLSLGGILLMHTIITSLTIGSLNLNYWYSYILFLIMIGGMLVLFIYMTSIASNEIFNPSIKIFIFMMSMFMLSMIIYYLIDNFYWTLNNTLTNENFNYWSLNKYFNFPNNMIMYLLIIYLLIALLTTVKITDFKKGALRSSLLK